MTDRDESRDEAVLMVERALIGALLLDRDAIASVVERLKPSEFQFSQTAKAYEAICALWDRRVPPDPITVAMEIERKGGESFSVYELASMETECFSHGQTVHAPYYADIISQEAHRRNIMRTAAVLSQRAYEDKNPDPAALFQQALSDLDTVGALPDGGAVSYEELVLDYQDRIDAMRRGELTVNKTPTGFWSLDSKLRGGFMPGELVVLAARPSMGKTALALQIAHNAARKENRVVIFSAEMGRDALMERAAAEVGSLSPSSVEDGSVDDVRWNSFLEAVDRLRVLTIHVDDTSGITTDRMIARVQRLQQHGPINLVIFDYLELAGDQVKGDSEERRVAWISKRMKHLARVCEVPVLLLCQLNRAVESRANKTPTLADLRYSGAIEQDADKVLFLYRHDYYVNQNLANEDANRVGTAEVIVAKHRSGDTGTVSLRFRPETMTFRELDELEEAFDA